MLKFAWYGVRTHASMTLELKSSPLDQLGHPCKHCLHFNSFVFLINSFNSQFYIQKTSLLLENIRNHITTTEIPVEYIVVCGGCFDNYHNFKNDTHYIGIVENLSDHNIYKNL
mgnify:CR=1 FL=1